MLVLTRKAGERILIGDNISITVVRTGDRVRLGIEAPKEVVILREEVALAPQSSKKPSDQKAAALPA